MFIVTVQLKGDAPLHSQVFATSRFSTRTELFVPSSSFPSNVIIFILSVPAQERHLHNMMLSLCDGVFGEIVQCLFSATHSILNMDHKDQSVFSHFLCLLYGLCLALILTYPGFLSMIAFFLG